MREPLISICIPAYKQVQFLRRLLNSIAGQSFKDFEVVVSDDSPGNEVEELCSEFKDLFKLIYKKNENALGTPENWNEAIRMAKGKWIKLMHNDDWFVNDEVLKQFYSAAVKYPESEFFFSAFQNVEEDNGEKKVVKCNWFDLLFLKISPLHLFRKVYVGNPSCTFIRRGVNLFYDNKFRFVVDFEYYIRCFNRNNNWRYIDEVLLNIGFHSEQVTKYTFLVAEVQIPENHQLIRQMGARILYNVFVYDYYWRMYRNLKIRSISEVKKFDAEKMHNILEQIINFQKNIPPSFLKIGLISKSCMVISYLVSLLRKH